MSSDFGEPNSVMFVTFLRVCSNLLPEGEAKGRGMASIFAKCCDHGQVDDRVLHVLESSLSTHQIRELTGCDVNKFGRIDLMSIPHEWTCNVDANKRRKPSNRRTCSRKS